MKKIGKITIVLISLIFLATQAWAVPSLGWWDEGVTGSTHQYWDFTSSNVYSLGCTNYGSNPEQISNPNPADVVAQINLVNGNYNPTSGSFSAEYIILDLKVENYHNQPNYKEIWVDLGFTGNITSKSVVAMPGSYSYESLQGPCPGTGADFGWIIVPNPYWEDILITIQGDACALATLDYVHVDTICIPAPGAILLGSIGVGLVGWLRRRRTF